MDDVERLERLARLLDDGKRSTTEYEAMKNRVLTSAETPTQSRAWDFGRGGRERRRVHLALMAIGGVGWVKNIYLFGYENGLLGALQASAFDPLVWLGAVGLLLWITEGPVLKRAVGAFAALSVGSVLLISVLLIAAPVFP